MPPFGCAAKDPNAADGGPNAITRKCREPHRKTPASRPPQLPLHSLPPGAWCQHITSPFCNPPASPQPHQWRRNKSRWKPRPAFHRLCPNRRDPRWQPRALRHRSRRPAQREVRASFRRFLPNRRAPKRQPRSPRHPNRRPALHEALSLEGTQALAAFKGMFREGAALSSWISRPRHRGPRPTRCIPRAALHRLLPNCGALNCRSRNQRHRSRRRSPH